MLKQNGKYAQLPGVPYPEEIPERPYAYQEYPKAVDVKGITRIAQNPDEEAYLKSLNNPAVGPSVALPPIDLATGKKAEPEPLTTESAPILLTDPLPADPSILPAATPPKEAHGITGPTVERATLEGPMPEDHGVFPETHEEVKEEEKHDA